ncbi:hypothetical protein PILCRDRAFT_763020, partial [Piloderma croceum F 1598]
VQYIPEWFPGAGFKRKARDWHKLCQATLNDPYEMTKRKIMCLSFLIDTEDDIAASAAVLYAGTVAAISSFLLALVLYPEVQIHGQEELDRVIGPDRLPTLTTDPPSLHRRHCLASE